jgi:hypothetical protein
MSRGYAYCGGAKLALDDSEGEGGLYSHARAFSIPSECASVSVSYIESANIESQSVHCFTGVKGREMGRLGTAGAEGERGGGGGLRIRLRSREADVREGAI